MKTECTLFGNGKSLRLPGGDRTDIQIRIIRVYRVRIRV